MSFREINDLARRYVRKSSSRALLILFSCNCKYFTHYCYPFINREYLSLDNLPLLTQLSKKRDFCFDFSPKSLPDDHSLISIL